MKSFADWKLSPVEIFNAVQAVNTFIDEVVSLSEPFKVKAIFVRCFTTSAVVIVNGEQFYVRQQYCYFVIGQQVNGDEVMVDSRYIFKP